MDDKLILGLAGMPGSGKSVVVKVAEERGYVVLVMGDVVRKEVERRGLKPNPENIGKVMLELRQKEGPAVISKRCIPKIKHMISNKLIIDGLRSLDEVEEFERHFPKFTLIAIHSSPETRFKRVYRRRRSDDPENWEIYHERNMRELSVGLGGVIAMAEYIIVNEEELEVVKEKIRKVLRRVEKKWMT